MAFKFLAALTLLVALPAAAPAQAPRAAPSASGEMARWQLRAQRVTIVRDDWGIAHVRGKATPTQCSG
jgi:acyl-homoserine-lactone acylase